mmetsp:Transcript_30626/g.55522  ORF Transcript_30626/g.55522 Transcript_30626/m.55522 type:complete len:281 (-) Transcript_30626:971-1813(-)
MFVLEFFACVRLIKDFRESLHRPEAGDSVHGGIVQAEFIRGISDEFPPECDPLGGQFGGWGFLLLVGSGGIGMLAFFIFFVPPSFRFGGGGSLGLGREGNVLFADGHAIRQIARPIIFRGRSKEFKHSVFIGAHSIQRKHPIRFITAILRRERQLHPALRHSPILHFNPPLGILDLILDGERAGKFPILGQFLQLFLGGDDPDQLESLGGLVLAFFVIPIASNDVTAEIAAIGVGKRADEEGIIIIGRFWFLFVILLRVVLFCCFCFRVVAIIFCRLFFV